MYNDMLEKVMAPHSSTLAWKIPWTEEPGRLQSMGLLRVGHDWATSLSLLTFMHWRRKWQPTPVFLPGESLGWGSLMGCHLWGRTWLKRLSSIMTCISPYHVKSTFTALRILCALPVHPSLISPLATTHSFTVSIVLPSALESHSM